MSANHPSRIRQGVYLCQCPKCIIEEDVDPETKRVVQGRYMGQAERKSHVKSHRGATIAASHYKTIQSKPEPPTSFPILLPPENGQTTPDGPTLREKRIFPDVLLDRLASVNDTLSLSNHDISHLSQCVLVFAHPPTRESKAMFDPTDDELRLLNKINANAPMIEHELWLKSTTDMLEECQAMAGNMAGYCRDLQKLARRIDKEVRLVAQVKSSQWEQQRQRLCQEVGVGVRTVNTSRKLGCHMTDINPLFVSCYVLISFMHLLCGVSLDKCRVLICALRAMLVLESREYDSAFTIPLNPERVILFLGLEPQIKPFICCPNCFQIYPFDPESIVSSPERCTYRATPKSAVCGQSLWSAKRNQATNNDGNLKKKPGKTPNPDAPIRLFLYHELEDWISGLYSRLDIEEHLDRSVLRKSTHSDATWDIMDAPELREFLGLENDPLFPFLRQAGTEGRLIFSLNMDGFNPYFNKESGKKASVCAMYMVSLNLPPAIRYEVANMFLVGIIPGPQEPSKQQINHLLRPLVDDLLEFWDPGFYLTSTRKYAHGRLIRGALGPLVCDLLAARQMSGFAGHSSRNFCSFCTLQHEDIANFDYKLWSSRTQAEHRRLAKQWRDAQSERRQDELYETYGVRWSELLRLPYWDPTRFVVIDSMHGFLLRLFQRHVRQIWGMSVDHDDGDGPSLQILEQDKPPYEEMVESRRILRCGSVAELQSLKANALKELCEACGLTYSGVKSLLVKNLINYRFERGWFDEDDEMCGDPSDILPSPIPKAPARGSVPKQKTDQKGNKRATNDPPTPEEIESGLLILDTGRKKKLSTLRKALLKELCVLKSLDFTEKVVVADLVDILENWRRKNGIIDDSGRLLSHNNFPIPGPVNKKQKKGTKVLGRQTLKEIRDDMDKLQLPSWLSPAPRNPGTQKQGKFTADQWRSFCTVNLVFTLTRLWGAEPEGSRKRRMLDNFLDLVTAVKLASMRRMTPEYISLYTFHMHRYLTTLLDLYPGTTIAPYQHLSLHFPSLLERFGPTHGWRCFPFERYNYILQKIPSNMKFGDLERTIFTKFCMGQQLQVLFKSHDQLPPELDDLIATWGKHFETDIRGTLKGDAFTFDESFREIEESQTWKTKETKVLPDEWYLSLKDWISANDQETKAATLPPIGWIRTKISRLGESYSTMLSSPAHSMVYYRRSNGSVSAGSIQGIFSHRRTRKDGLPKTQTFFVIRQYRPLPREFPDFFTRFPLVGGGIFEDTDFHGSTMVISGDELLHHFARGRIIIPGFESSCFVALPLNRS